MHVLRAMLAKDLRRGWSDRRALVINMGLPLLLTFIMGLAFGGLNSGKGISAIPVALVADDLPAPLRDRLAAGLAESGFFQPTWTDSAGADVLVRAGDVAAALVLPDDVLARYFRGEAVTLQVWQDPNSQIKADIVAQIVERGVRRLQAGEAAYRALWPDDVDPAGWEDSGADLRQLLEGDLPDVWRRLRDPDYGGRVADLQQRLLRHMDHEMALAGVMGREQVALAVTDAAALGEAEPGRDVNLFNVFLPGFGVFFLMFGVAAGARDIHRERAGGTYQRQRLSPTGASAFLAAKWLNAWAQGVVSLGLLLLLGALLFRVNLGPDPWTLPLATAACAAAASGFFVLLAVLTPSEKVLDNLSTVVILVGAMIGGNFSLDAMQPWLHGVARVFFNYWANVAFNGIMAKDLGLAGVAQPLLVLASLAVAFTAAALLVHGRRSRGGAA